MVTWSAMALVRQDVRQRVSPQPAASDDAPASPLRPNALVLVQGTSVRYFYWHLNCPELQRQNRQLQALPTRITRRRAEAERDYVCATCRQLDEGDGTLARPPVAPPRRSSR